MTAPHTGLTPLFRTFFRIGICSIGGGYVMIPLMRQELVARRQWLSDQELLDCFAISQATPGVIAVNTATYVGYRQRGVAGALAATLGMVLPSLLTIMTIALFFREWHSHPVVQKAFAGIRVAVAFLLFNAVVPILRKSVCDRFSLLLALTAFAGVMAAGLSPVLLVPAAAAAGLLAKRKEPCP